MRFIIFLLFSLNISCVFTVPDDFGLKFCHEDEREEGQAFALGPIEDGFFKKHNKGENPLLKEEEGGGVMSWKAEEKNFLEALYQTPVLKDYRDDWAAVNENFSAFHETRQELPHFTLNIKDVDDHSFSAEVFDLRSSSHPPVVIRSVRTVDAFWGSKHGVPGYSASLLMTGNGYYKSHIQCFDLLLDFFPIQVQYS